MKLKIRTPDELRESQRLMSRLIQEREAVMLISGMGSGKTGGTLDAAVELLNELKVLHILVIGPRFVAQNTWPDEIKQWKHTQAISCAVAVGTAEERQAAIEQRAEITCINFDNLQWLAKTIKSVENWYWDMVIVDESSRFGAGEGRTKATKTKHVNKQTGEITIKARKGGNMTRFGVMTTARRKIKRIVELTGTPGDLMKLWGQSYLLDQGEALGRDKSKFEAKWFDKDPYNHTITPRANAEADILSAMGNLAVTIPPEKVAEDAQFIPMRVRLPEKAMLEYRELEKTLYSQVHDVEAVSKGVLANKLLQMCLAESTPVLTGRGWVPIQDVRPADLIWDGVEWVETKGPVLKGFRHVVACYGVEMTPDHSVLTTAGWKTASEVNNGNDSGRFEREVVRIPHGPAPTWHDDKQEQKGHMVVPMCMRERSSSHQSEPSPFREAPTESDSELRLYARGNHSTSERGPWCDRYATLGDLAGHEAALSQSSKSRFSQLRRSRHRYARRMVQFILSILERCSTWVRGASDDRSTAERNVLRKNELPLGRYEDTDAQYSCQRDRGISMGCDDLGGSGGTVGLKVCDGISSICEGGPGSLPFPPSNSCQRSVEDGARSKVAVYDLIDCGPRHRFVVLGHDGKMLIVHNCNGSIYREDRSVSHVHDAKMEALDELFEMAPDENWLVFYGFQFDKDAIRKRYPDAVVANEYRGDLVADWNKGRIKKLLAHPASIGHGTNLQYGGHLAAWFGLTWSLELWQQANMRLPRPGQTKQVLIYPIIAEGTYDERALSVLQDKESTQDRIIQSFLYRY